MSLTDAQTAWLTDLTGVVADVEDFEETEALKAQSREQFDAVVKGSLRERRPDALELPEWDLVESSEPGARDRYGDMPVAAILKEAFSVELTYVKADGKRVRAALLMVELGQSSEVDPTEADPDEVKALSDKDNLLLQVGMLLHGEVLRAAHQPPLDKKDTEALLAGMARERIMPEGMIPDELSQTQKMLDESNAYYNADLEEFTRSSEETTDSKLQKLLETGGEVASITHTLLKALPGDQIALAADIAKLTALTLETGALATEVWNSGDWRGSGRSLVDRYEKISKSILKLALPPDSAKLACQLVTAELAVAKVGASLAKKPPDIDGAVDALAGGMKNALGAAGSIESQNGDPGQGAVLTEIGKAVSASIMGAYKAGKLGKRAHAGEVTATDFVNEMSAIGQSALKASFAIQSAKDQDDLRDELAKKDPPPTKEELDLALKGIQDKSDEERDGIGDIVALATTATVTAIIVVQAARTKDLPGLAEDILSGIGDTLQQSLDLAGVPKETAHLINNSFLSLSSAGLIANHLAAGDDAKAIATMGSYMRGAIEIAGGPDNNDMSIAAQSVALAFQSAAAGLESARAINAGDYKALIETMEGYAQTAVTAGLGIHVTDQSRGLDDDTAGDMEDDAERLGEIIGDGADLTKPIDREDGVLKQLKGEIDDPKIIGFKSVGAEALAFLQTQTATIQANVEAVKAEEAEAEEEAQRLARDEADQIIREADVEMLIRRGDDVDRSASDTQKIERLIADMQRDRMILELATKVTSGGTAVAKQFIPALGIAHAGVKLAANLVAAAKRATALNDWIHSRDDFEVAASALSTSAESFVTQQREQFSYYAIQAALDLATLIGESLKLGGITAAAGAAVAGAAEAAQATQDLIRTFYKEAELKRAWAITQRALQNPGNRRLALEARAMNPTLAKYSIAWAAVDDNDPLAKAAVSQCKLTDAALRNQDTNVKNVQKYLEVYFSEDLQVRGRVELAVPWLPPSLSLSMKSWSALKHRGVEHDQLANADAEETPEIDRALTRLVDLRAASAAWLDGDDPAPLQAHRDALDALEPLMERWQKTYAYKGSFTDAHNAVEFLLSTLSEERLPLSKALAA